MQVIELLHDITQKGYEVYFSDDFKGMLTITFKEAIPEKNSDGYVRHEHVNYPDGSIKDLEKAVIKSLARFFNEIEDGSEPKKDEL